MKPIFTGLGYDLKTKKAVIYAFGTSAEQVLQRLTDRVPEQVPLAMPTPGMSVPAVLTEFTYLLLERGLCGVEVSEELDHFCAAMNKQHENMEDNKARITELIGKDLSMDDKREFMKTIMGSMIDKLKTLYGG